MTRGNGRPFDTIESAQEYVSLLIEAVNAAHGTIEQDIEPADTNPRQRHDALQLVNYKLERLTYHLETSRRILLDLRILRSLLLGESDDAVETPFTAPRNRATNPIGGSRTQLSSPLPTR